MQALVRKSFGKGLQYVTDAPIPTPKSNEVLIKIKATAICGTDYSSWKGNDAGKKFEDKYVTKYPFIIGHEFSGDVVAVGDDVKSIKVGDRVSAETHIYCDECYQCKHNEKHNCQKLRIYGFSCDGCFADYTVCPENILFKLSDEITYDQGALYEPAACAMFGIQESHIKEGDTVLIYGAGPIGQMAIELALASGAKTVISSDINDSRVEVARKLGAVAVNSAKEDLGEIVKKYTADRGGVDIIIELSGSPAIYETMADYLRKEGCIIFLAHPGGNVSIDVMKLLHHSGATVKGVFGRRIWDSWTALDDLVKSGKVDISNVITHRFPLKDADKAFEAIENGAGKVLLIPDMK